MPIEVNCENCSALLRVADEHAGKRAKCPNCDSVNNIPEEPYGADALLIATQVDPQTGTPYSPHPNAYHGGSNPYLTPQQHQPRYAEAERGGIIFALGIVGLLICQIPGIFAFFMGKKDLAKMKAGVMDPSGEGLTQAGMIMGLIAMILLAIAVLFLVGYFILAIVLVAGAAAGGGI